MKLKVIKGSANYVVNIYGTKKVVKGSILATMIRNNKGTKINYEKM